MSRTVFILGAGASADIGVPVMRNFLDVAYDLRRTTESLQHGDAFDAVFRGIDALQSVYAKSFLDLRNVESVFAAFEMGKLLGRLGGLSPEEVTQAPQNIRKVIVSTIEQTTRFPIKRNPLGVPESPQTYNQFANALKQLQKPVPEQGPWRCSVITFNYDIALDYALWNSQIDYNYGLSPDEGLPVFRLLKLHGSINWLRCTKCHQVFPVSFEDHARAGGAWRDVGSNHCVYRISGSYRYEHCGEEAPHDPVIVPPTWNKTQHQETIAEVWRHAAHELATAEDVIICGYSLPARDQFFRYLFALGAAGPARIRRFWVFNPDNAVEGAFRQILGGGITDRFQFEAEEFGPAISRISSRLTAEP